ncbi:BLUF domain-containing protein [Polaromonas sp. YR568]|uniref:BLUF domain-containing protein n=1 Tax=Polaromonas sp. YR568 TaxID=1855301 RepID=UPI0031383963
MQTRPLIRLLYVSRAAGPQTGTVSTSILSVAQTNNRKNGITGVLCQGQGLYLQVLEGQRSAVNQLYAAILNDKRHHDVELLQLEEITTRRYPDWSMAHVELSDQDLMIRMNHPDFDPYTASGSTVMQLLTALVSSGDRLTMPPA